MLSRAWLWLLRPGLLQGLCLATLGLHAPTAPAQQLTLFLDNGGDGRQPAMALPAAEVGALAAAQPFTLRSRSRFGERHLVALVDTAGQVLDVEWTPGGAAEVPGHGGYHVVAVDAQGVVLQLPPGITCLERADAGVSCPSAAQARLTLATLSPVPSNLGGDPLAMADAAAPEVGVIEAVPLGPGDLEGNPFLGPLPANVMTPEELALRNERARARAERMRMMPERDPGQQAVPGGMRVFRTPFGDRAFPERE